MVKARKIVAYLAHPVGPGTTPEELDARLDNIANALAWLQWLVDHTSWCVCVPWLPYVQRLDENTYRGRGIDDDLAALERCDILVGVGGRWSEGMTAEREHAKSQGMPIVDLTSYGFAPPKLEIASGKAVVALRATNAIRARARRVWLPPIEPSHLLALKTLRMLAAPQLAGLDDVGAYLSRIIDDAERMP